MSTTPKNDRLETVPATTIYQIFADVVQLPGFQTVRKGALAKQISDDVIHLITLTAYKGATYGFRWGVSLTYVPHRWENELRWHRSIKSATLDLWEQLADLPEAFNLTQLPPNSSIPSSLHGPERFEERLRAEWRDLRSTITSWLEKVSDLPGVLAMSEQQMQRPWKGPRHWPPPSFVRAFTLARMGEFGKATVELKANADGSLPDPNGLLSKALQQVSARTQLDHQSSDS
jgi:hypothetical protein